MRNLLRTLSPGQFVASFGTFGCFMAVAVFVAVAFWTDRNLDFWFSFFKGEAVDVSWWLSLVLTIVHNAEIAKFAV